MLKLPIGLKCSSPLRSGEFDRRIVNRLVKRVYETDKQDSLNVNLESPMVTSSANYGKIGKSVSVPESQIKKKPPIPKEIGGQKGPEPTRFGDWEKNGRCTDF